MYKLMIVCALAMMAMVSACSKADDTASETQAPITPATATPADAAAAPAH